MAALLLFINAYNSGSLPGSDFLVYLFLFCIFLRYDVENYSG